MAKRMTAQEVFSRVTALEQSNDMQTYRRLMEENWKLHTMQAGSVLPDYVTRRAQVEVGIPSELVMDASQNLLSAVNAYPRFLSVVPIAANGKPTADQTSNADAVERHDTLARNDLDKESHVSPQVRWHQANSGYAVAYARLLPPPKGEGRKKPFRHMVLDMPDPTTCYFPMKNGGTFRPGEFGMKVKALVRDIEADYADWDGGGEKPIITKGKWTMVALDDTKSTEEGDTYTGHRPDNKDKELPYEVELYTYCIGECVYIACKGAQGGRDQGRFAKTDDNGIMLYEGENPVGHVMAYVVPGQATPLRQAGKQALPVLEALYVNQKGVNFLTQFVATISLSNPSDMVINSTPEQLQAMKDLGLVTPASALELEAGGPYLIHVGGNATEWKWAPTEGPIELLKMKREDGIALANNWKPLIDRELLSQSTLGGIQIGTEAQESLKHDMLVHLDDFWSMVMEDYNASAVSYNDAAPMMAYASGDVRRANGNEMISQGSGHGLSKKLLEDLGEHRVYVSTRQETEAQLGFRLQQGFLEEDRQITSHRQVIGIKYPDATAQLKELARDLGRGLMQPVVMQTADLLFEAEMLTELGLRVPANFAAGIMAQSLAGPMAPMQQNPAQQNAPPATGGAVGEAEAVPV